ncbi:MAG: hypothetical protein RI933_1029, partial [Actinomycetota bacterium]
MANVIGFIAPALTWRYENRSSDQRVSS